MNASDGNINFKDELNLVEIYIALKKEIKLLFIIVLFSILLSLGYVFYSYKNNSAVSESESQVISYVETTAWLEIGQVILEHGNARVLFDNPYDTIAKLKEIYIPLTFDKYKQNQRLYVKSFTAKHVPNTNIFSITIIGNQNQQEIYKGMIKFAAQNLIDDHLLGFNKPKNTIQYFPTRIIHRFSKIYDEKTVLLSIPSKKYYFIVIYGTIFGIIIGFFAVFIKLFLRKVKDVEAKLKRD